MSRDARSDGGTGLVIVEDEMKRWSLAGIVLFLLVGLLSGRPTPADTVPLAVVVERDATTGRPIALVVDVEAPSNAWLGRSLYPRGVTNPARQGDHALVAVGRGAFHESFAIPAGDVGGTWEVALWGKKVELKVCKAAPGGCATCKAYGYHLEQSLAYKSGKIGPEPTVRLASEVATDRGVLRLALSGEVKEGEVWIGRSMYPKGVRDGLKEGDHTAVKVANAPINLAWPVDARFQGGSYEAAAWRERVERADCKSPGCAYCRQLGFHLNGLVTYKSGTLAAVLAATLETVVAADGSGAPAALRASGRVVNGRAWLGRSLYPAGAKDAAAEGDHLVLEIADREFEETWPLDARFVGGTYEIALWGRQVAKADCKIKDCRFCARQGYHLDGLLAWKDGKFVTAAK